MLNRFSVCIYIHLSIHLASCLSIYLSMKFI